MKRRRNIFVLLFVLALIAVSGIVIANKQTQLGLDLKGGVQLVLQGRPTPQQPTIDSASMERAVDIIRSGCDQLGVSEIEVARVGNDQIQVGIPGATSVGQATECATKPARLYFFDWEPNLIGREKAIGGTPGREPPKAALEEAEKEWNAAGRSPSKQENGQLVAAGAYASEYNAAKLAAEQKPVPGLRKLQPADDLLPVPERAAAQADLRPRVHPGRPLHRPQRQEAAAQRGRSREGAAGDDPDLRETERQQGPDDRRRAARLVRVQGRPRAFGDRNQQPEGRTAGIRTRGHLPVQRRRPPGLPGSHPPDRPARPGARDRPASGRTGRTALRPLRRGARQRSQNDGRSSTSPKTPTGSTAAPGRRSLAASTAYPTPRTSPPTCSAARCRSTST